MVVPGALDRRELRRVEISEIDAADLGAERGAGRNHLDRFGADLARNLTVDA